MIKYMIFNLIFFYTMAINSLNFLFKTNYLSQQNRLLKILLHTEVHELISYVCIANRTRDQAKVPKVATAAAVAAVMAPVSPGEIFWRSPRVTDTAASSHQPRPAIR